jgi:hypothetical protein
MPSVISGSRCLLNVTSVDGRKAWLRSTPLQAAFAAETGRSPPTRVPSICFHGPLARVPARSLIARPVTRSDIHHSNPIEGDHR